MRPSFAVSLLLFAAATACSPTVSMPSNVSVGAGATLPEPQNAPNNAPPKILAAHFNALDLARPAQWTGTIVTTTNVASVELKTNQFSINVPRDRFGHFAFTMDVFDVPAEFIRPYVLRIIARNSAGTELEEDAPMRIR